MNNLTAVSIGDIDGIGIQILIKEWKNKKINNFVLFCNEKILTNYLKRKKINLKINIVNKKNNEIQVKKNNFNIYNYKSKNNDDNTYKSIIISYNLCKKKLFIGLVTLPLSKEKIIKKIDKNFIGHTELLKKIDKKKTVNMIFKKNKLLIVPITTHIKLKNVIKLISKKDYLLNKIKLLNYSLKKDFKINNPKFLISGINPHAGENGLIGNEEIKIIKPIIKLAKKNMIKIYGPISADSMINLKNIKKYDCFIFIYHDQGLIPFKILSKNSGVNFTANLDILRTSPDHGTAYDLVNSNEASSRSIINAFRLLKIINKNRNKI